MTLWLNFFSVYVWRIVPKLLTKLLNDIKYSPSIWLFVSINVLLRCDSLFACSEVISRNICVTSSDFGGGYMTINSSRWRFTWEYLVGKVKLVANSRHTKLMRETRGRDRLMRTSYAILYNRNTDWTLMIMYLLRPPRELTGLTGTKQKGNWQWTHSFMCSRVWSVWWLVLKLF